MNSSAVSSRFRIWPRSWSAAPATRNPAKLVDACAGEGGKTLHLADLMQNKGLIWASDRSIRRLHVLKQRTARAGVFNYRAVAWNGGPQPPTRTRFDGILVDAPCSGVGTWQRNPHARWTVSPADVHELAAVQRQLLDHVAGALKPGGRLIYAVCTLTRAETSGLAAEFSRIILNWNPPPCFRPPAFRGRQAMVSPPSPGRPRPPAVLPSYPGPTLAAGSESQRHVHRSMAEPVLAGSVQLNHEAADLLTAIRLLQAGATQPFRCHLLDDKYSVESADAVVDVLAVVRSRWRAVHLL